MKHLQMGFMALRLPGSNWDSRNWKGTSAAWTLKDIIEALLESSAALPCRGTCAILPGQSCPPVLICFARLVVVESSLVLCVRFGLFYGSFSPKMCPLVEYWRSPQTFLAFSYPKILVIEGSLEVKLPTTWTDGKAEVGRVREEKRREEERRSEKRKSQKKEDVGARKGRKVARNTVFFFQWLLPSLSGYAWIFMRMDQLCHTQWPGFGSPQIPGFAPLWHHFRLLREDALRAFGDPIWEPGWTVNHLPCWKPYIARIPRCPRFMLNDVETCFEAKNISKLYFPWPQ